MIKKAMILAAGFGKRVHPLTLKCPKPLLKIGNETLLSNTIKFLKRFATSSASSASFISLNGLESNVLSLLLFRWK